MPSHGSHLAPICWRWRLRSGFGSVAGHWRWKAVLVGSFVPALLVLMVAIVYTESESPLLTGADGRRQTGGIAVFLGAAIRLLRPQLDGASPLAFAAISFLIVWIFPVNLFV